MVEFRGDGLSARFTVELATTPEERSRGLMFREAMALSAGMLFVYPKAQSVSFWMKNTLIPLDMIFMDETGTVVSVGANAVPGDLSPVHGGNNIQYVLEINGGFSETLGLDAGDQMQHPVINPEIAAWPCE